MNSTIRYKGYIGSVEFSETDKLFFGKVQGTHALISYEGNDIAALISDFHSVIDDYLELCATERKEP